MVKFLILFLIASPLYAKNLIAVCGSGDAVNGVDIYQDENALELQISSMDDQQPNEVYRTDGGDLKGMGDLDAAAIAATITKGVKKTVLFGKPDTITFGGMISNVAYLNIEVNIPWDTRYKANLIYNGNLLAMFCNLPKDIPGPVLN